MAHPQLFLSRLKTNPRYTSHIDVAHPPGKLLRCRVKDNPRSLSTLIWPTRR